MDHKLYYLALILLNKFFLPFKGLERLVEPLRNTCTMKVNPNSVKQEFEKQDELKRSALRAVAALLTIQDAGKTSLLDVIFILKYSSLL